MQKTQSRTLRQTQASGVLKRPAALTAGKPDSPLAEFTTFEGSPDFVLSLARGLTVIEAFENCANGLSVADVSRRTGLSRASVRRLLITLGMLGYSELNGRTYRLKPRILKLGFSYLSSSSLPALAEPILQSVTEAVHESSSLSVLEGDEIVYVARSATRRIMSVALSVGSRLPAYCTSMGRVLLAAMPDEKLSAHLKRMDLRALTPKTVVDRAALAAIIKRARSEGFALVDEELELGLRSIAVPVRTRQDRIVAAMNIGVHAARVSYTEMVDRFLPVLRDHARMLGQSLG